MPEFRDSEVRKSIVGKHRPEEPSREPSEHILGFGIALQNALDDAKELLFPSLESGEARTFNVAVRFEATVTVRNPGAIDEYRAFVTEP